MATKEEIIAMKVDVISRGGRKKDFWDIDEVIAQYTIEEMLSLHEKCYPHNHDKALIIAKFTDFDLADEDFDPICLKGKYWEIVKLNIIDLVKGL